MRRTKLCIKQERGQILETERDLDYRQRYHFGDEQNQYQSQLFGVCSGPCGCGVVDYRRGLLNGGWRTSTYAICDAVSRANVTGSGTPRGANNTKIRDDNNVQEI